MKIEELMVNHLFERITKLLEHISSKVWENCRGLEFGPKRGGIGSVIKLTMAKQVCKKLIILRLDLLESCRSFDNFNPDASLKLILVYFFLVTRSISICCLWGLVVLLFCSLMPEVKILYFWSEIVKRLFGATHVFGSNFTFCNFVFLVEL